MKIVALPEFKIELDDILAYIAQDSIENALNFNRELEFKINNLVNFPYKNRQSIYFSEENNRDMTFKGYTITYHIDETDNKIVLLGIKKYKKRFLIENENFFRDKLENIQE